LLLLLVASDLCCCVTAGDWEGTVAAAVGSVGLGVGGCVATVELVATSFVVVVIVVVLVAAAATVLEEIVLGTCPAGGAVVGWLTLAGFSEVTSSLAVGCDEGRTAATVVFVVAVVASAAAVLLLLSVADTDAVLTVAPATVPLETDVAAAEVLVGGITEGLLGG